MFLCPIAQNRLNAHNENKLRTNFDNLKKTQSMILYLLTNPSLVPDFYCLHNKRKPHHALSDLKKNTNAEAGNTNCLFSTFFATTEMLKHLNTGKKGGWHHHLRLNFLFLFFLCFFFICLAITTDDIAQHWESSSKAWETAVANQIMSHGVIHLRVTLTLLPLWHAHARRKSVSLSRTRSRTRSQTEEGKKS